MCCCLVAFGVLRMRAAQVRDEWQLRGAPGNVEALALVQSHLAAAERLERSFASKTRLRQLLAARTTAAHVARVYAELLWAAKTVGLSLVCDPGEMQAALEVDAASLPEQAGSLPMLRRNESQLLETLADIETAESVPAELRTSQLAAARAEIVTLMGRGRTARRSWSIAAGDVEVVRSAPLATQLPIAHGARSTASASAAAASDIVLASETAVAAPHSVFLGRWNAMDVAVRFISGIESAESAEQLAHEASEWYGLQHPNILPLWRACLDTDEPFIVLPLMRCSLSGWLGRHPDAGITRRLDLVLDIARGIGFLHASGIVHGEVWSDSVLVGHDGRALLTRFKSNLIHGRRLSRRPAALARWAAPEASQRRSSQPLKSQDAFSFAMTCVEIFSGRIPFAAEPSDEVVRERLRQGFRPDRPDGVPDLVWRIITECWSPDPLRRPEFSEIVERLGLFHQVLAKLKREAGVASEPLASSTPPNSPPPSPSSSSMPSSTSQVAFPPQSVHLTPSSEHSMVPKMQSSRTSTSGAATAGSKERHLRQTKSQYYDRSNQPSIRLPPRSRSLSDHGTGLATGSRSEDATQATTLSEAAEHVGHRALDEQTRLRAAVVRNNIQVIASLAAAAAMCWGLYTLAGIVAANWTAIGLTMGVISVGVFVAQVFGSFSVPSRPGTQVNLPAPSHVAPRPGGESDLAILIRIFPSWAKRNRVTIDHWQHINSSTNVVGDHGSAVFTRPRIVINNDGRITELRLTDVGLDGELSSEIGKLDQLRVLELNRNRLQGRIPFEIGQLVHLERLWLSDNNFLGEIPTSIGNLRNLQTLVLSHNQLYGEIPSEIGYLISLQGLWLSYNKLSGKIPAELGNLPQLKFFEWEGNRFHSDLPANLERLL
ncbi:hypothetical protein HK105_204751 [Polyrhizophydium stewartii]|uniref:Protein kinase domain-containing protein n=1 Tax=Polyrhizophydium stewartii TaxID=2732419 RepID=A0ABR4N8F8_9FUNG